MKVLFSENYSSTPTMKKVGQGTQKVKNSQKKLKCHTLPNLSPLEVEFQVEYQTQVGIPI